MAIVSAYGEFEDLTDFFYLEICEQIVVVVVESVGNVVNIWVNFYRADVAFSEI